MVDKRFLERPELMLGNNPFIEANAPFIPFKDLGREMTRYPLEGLNFPFQGARGPAKDWRSYPAAYREPLLASDTLHFVPNRENLQVAAHLQRMFRAGLVLRCPAEHEERIRTLQVSGVQTRAELRSLPRLQGGGAILKGLTGTGKTELLKRTMELMCPLSKIEMGSSKVYGWNRLIHVPYLYLDYPSNGTRVGLLKRVLEKLDEVTGSSLSTDFKRVNNIDVLLVEVCRQLSNVRCSVLCVDEKQGSNFEESPWLLEFVLFYLSLMNLGVNVVMAGNPLAFVHLELFSQVMRRFSVGGQHTFEPAESLEVPWWKQDAVRRIRKFCVVEECRMDAARRDEFEFENTGGIQGLLTCLNKQAQICSLNRARGDHVAVLEEQDFIEARESAAFRKLREIAVAAHGAATAEEQTYADIPVGTAALGTKSKSSKTLGSSVSSSGESTANVVRKLMGRFKAESTKKADKFITRLNGLSKFTPEDLELLGITQSHLAEMHKILKV